MPLGLKCFRVSVEHNFWCVFKHLVSLHSSNSQELLYVALYAHSLS